MVILEGGSRFFGHWMDGMKTGFGILERPAPWTYRFSIDPSITPGDGCEGGRSEISH